MSVLDFVGNLPFGKCETLTCMESCDYVGV